MKCNKCRDSGFIVKILDTPYKNKDGIWKDREYIRCDCGVYNWQFDKDRLGNMVYELKKLGYERKHEIETLEIHVNEMLDLLISGLYNNEKNRNFIMWNIKAKMMIESLTGKSWEDVKALI